MEERGDLVCMKAETSINRSEAKKAGGLEEGELPWEEEIDQEHLGSQKQCGQVGHGLLDGWGNISGSREQNFFSPLHSKPTRTKLIEKFGSRI